MLQIDVADVHLRDSRVSLLACFGALKILSFIVTLYLAVAKARHEVQNETLRRQRSILNQI